MNSFSPVASAFFLWERPVTDFDNSIGLHSEVSSHSYFCSILLFNYETSWLKGYFYWWRILTVFLFLRPRQLHDRPIVSIYAFIDPFGRESNILFLHYSEIHILALKQLNSLSILSPCFSSYDLWKKFYSKGSPRMR